MIRHRVHWAEVLAPGVGGWGSPSAASDVARGRGRDLDLQPLVLDVRNGVGLLINRAHQSALTGLSFDWWRMYSALDRHCALDFLRVILKLSALELTD